MSNPGANRESNLQTQLDRIETKFDEQVEMNDLSRRIDSREMFLRLERIIKQNKSIEDKLEKILTYREYDWSTLLSMVPIEYLFPDKEKGKKFLQDKLDKWDLS